MFLRTLMLALAVTASAIPLASVDSTASSATIDIAKRINETLNSIETSGHDKRSALFKRENEAGASIDVAKRNQTELMDVA